MPQPRLDAFEKSTVELALFARALAHPARIRILQYLSGRGEVPCMEIVGALPLSQPACSRHINELRRAGLLTARTSGSHVFFKLREPALAAFCLRMGEALHPSPANTP